VLGWLIRRGASLLCSLVVIASTVGASAAASTPSVAACAGSVADQPQQNAAPGHPCWVDVDPYPFGSAGSSVVSSQCVTQQSACLTATSFAFRAWNRGLAATSGSSGNPFGVWLYNGARWFPDPTFPGSKTCPGGTALWAGKLDYWLIGQTNSSTPWANLCRFDGVNYLWEPLSIPAAALANVPLGSNGKIAPGGITSGACYSYDNCWFFGTFGIVLHWDGNQLSDATPDLAASPWLAVDYEDAFTGSDSTGNPFGVAVAASTDGTGKQLPLRPGGAPPAQLFSSSGSGWQAAAFTPPTADVPSGSDPYLTDLVAVSFDGAGHGWAAGNPSVPQGTTAPDPTPAPLIPLVTQGQDPGCGDLTTLGRSTSGKADSYRWTSIAAVQNAAVIDAVAGGSLTPAAGGSTGSASSSQPVLVSVGVPASAGPSCTPSVLAVTRFLTTNRATGAATPVDPNGSVTAVAMNATNDGWAATTTGVGGAPHIYHFTDGTSPLAPAGNDAETRPLQLKEDPPIIVFAPLPPTPPPPPAPAPVVTATAQQLPQAISNLHSHLKTVTTRHHRRVRIHGRLYRETTFKQKFTLYLTFTVQRSVMLGLEALRKGHIVSSTGLERFAPHSGRFVLELTRAKWPTKLAFLTDLPTVALSNPGTVLTGDVNLAATAAAIKGRSVKSVAFEYSPHGANNWAVIATTTGAPFTASFDTTGVPNGAYDLEAVVTDSAGTSAVSPVLTNREIQN
jgi:hypothetical protein